MNYRLVIVCLAVLLCTSCAGEKIQEKIEFTFIKAPSKSAMFDEHILLPGEVRGLLTDNDGYVVRYKRMSHGSPSVVDDETIRLVSLFIPNKFVIERRNVVITKEDGLRVYEYSAALEGEASYCLQELPRGEIHLSFKKSIIVIAGTVHSEDKHGPRDAICDDSSFALNDVLISENPMLQ